MNGIDENLIDFSTNNVSYSSSMFTTITLLALGDLGFYLFRKYDSVNELSEMLNKVLKKLIEVFYW